MKFVLERRLAIANYTEDLPGLPGTTPQSFTSELFWCCVSTVGHLWHRLVAPYRQPPLNLARLVDHRTNERYKRRLAQWFLDLPDCCQCSSFLKPLGALKLTQDDLLEGCGRSILHAAFHCKNTNLEVEDNFARAVSMKGACRGKTDKSHTMFSKHLLADLRAAHLKDRMRAEAGLDNADQQRHEAYLVARDGVAALEDEGAGIQPAGWDLFHGHSFDYDFNRSTLLFELS